MEPLTIKEAKGDVISLKDVPAEGATALIPVNLEHPSHHIEVLIGEEVVVEKKVGNPIDGFYEIPVPKESLLRHVGLKKVFKYRSYDGAGNPEESFPKDYDIIHG
jgi:hypothetical protein